MPLACFSRNTALRALVPALPHRPWFLKSFTSAQPGSYILLYPGGLIKILISQTYNNAIGTYAIGGCPCTSDSLLIIKKRSQQFKQHDNVTKMDWTKRDELWEFSRIFVLWMACNIAQESYNDIRPPSLSIHQIPLWCFLTASQPQRYNLCDLNQFLCTCTLNSFV